MLRKIKLSNFKCFERLDLTCFPITLLCGLNGMGKSTVIQALLLLRQSYVTGDLKDGKLVLVGELADLGTGRDILFEGADSDHIGIELRHDDLPTPWAFSFNYSETADVLATEFSTGRGESASMELEDWSSVPPFASNLLYIGADRSGPRKVYPLSDVYASRGDFGSASEYALNYLNRHQNDRMEDIDPRCHGISGHRLIDVVNGWLQDVTPGVQIQFETVPAADALIAGFSFNQPGDVATRPYRPTNVGFGLSYTLPVLLALLAKKGTLCLIENPEAHLHPKGQTKLAELAVRASIAGVQVLVETHSDHFMDGVRIAVRNGVISPEEVGFQYFERINGKTTVTSPQIDEDGRLSSWPSGFFDQHEENLAQLISPRS